MFVGYSQVQWLVLNDRLATLFTSFKFCGKICFCVTKPFRFSEVEISMSQMCSPSTTTWQTLSLLVPSTRNFVCIPLLFKSSWFHLLLDSLDPFPSARDIHFSFWVVFHLCTCKLILASFNAKTLKKVVLHLLCTCKPILVILIT